MLQGGGNGSKDVEEEMCLVFSGNRKSTCMKWHLYRAESRGVGKQPKGHMSENQSLTYGPYLVA